jgi:hypothetical protein
MTRDVLMTRIAAIVSSLGDEGTPESMLYILCDMNMADWETVRDILVRGKLVSIKGHYVTLTESGKTTAAELNKLLKVK